MYTTRLHLTASEIELLDYIFGGLHWYELCQDDAGYYLQEKDTGTVVCWENGLVMLLLTRDKSIEEEIPSAQKQWNNSFGMIDLTEAREILYQMLAEGVQTSYI